MINTIASQCELNVFDWLVLQLAVQAKLNLLELLQEPDDNDDHDDNNNNDNDVKDSGDKDEDVKDGGEPDGLALLHSDVLLLPLAVGRDQGKEHHLKKASATLSPSCC